MDDYITFEVTFTVEHMTQHSPATILGTYGNKIHYKKVEREREG